MKARRRARPRAEASCDSSRRSGRLPAHTCCMNSVSNMRAAWTSLPRAWRSFSGMAPRSTVSGTGANLAIIVSSCACDIGSAAAGVPVKSRSPARRRRMRWVRAMGGNLRAMLPVPPHGGLLALVNDGVVLPELEAIADEEVPGEAAALQLLAIGDHRHVDGA